MAEVISYVKQAMGAVSEGIDKGMIATALKVVAQAKALAPVDTGQLKNSIEWGRDGEDLIVGTNNDHAVYQEFGTRNMTAQPYLRPAVAIVVNGMDADKAMKKAMRNSVGKVLKK